MAILLPPLREDENANVNLVVIVDFVVVEEVVAVAIMAAMMDAAAILRFIVSYRIKVRVQEISIRCSY